MLNDTKRLKKGKSGGPEFQWGKFESKVVLENQEITAAFNSTDSNKLYRLVNLEIVKILERYMRALSRVFTLSGISFLRPWSVGVTHFICLPDRKFGETVYADLLCRS